MNQSWAPHVRTRGETDWTKNGLRFATKEEAEGWAHDLSGRWTAVEETGAVEAPEPVNYRFNLELRVLECLEVQEL